MNKLLIDDYPIQVLPQLAVEIGLNEAIFLQQLHYWLNGKSSKFIDGHKWIYNTYNDWEKQFPFWSNATIRRTINSCEKKKVILVANYNRAGFDKTKWYSINYEEVNRLSKRIAQNEQTSSSKRADGDAQNEQPNTIDYPEITSETTKEANTSNRDSMDERFEEIWSLYPKKTMKKEALAAYKKAVKSGTDPTEIEAGVRRYLQDLKANQWKSPMDGGRWFKKERWMDVYETKVLKDGAKEGTGYAERLGF